MNSLSTALIIQIVLCVILFGILFYLMIKNSELKKELSSKIKNPPTKGSED
ncbi:MAG: hypothetical protein ACE10J_02930 [Thermodesulfobacteriota bacterium]|jgi:preprotein translocase subunit YajC|nr:hypothetical protein [Candidatus Dadabacteria bacterium]MCH7948902.1 hypothetical protein [Candidatus Dadabacteria bacterium]